MKLRLLLVGFVLVASLASVAQSFELLDRTENYSTGISQTIRIPIKIKNTSEKAQFYIVRLTTNELSGTQNGYFCLDKTCLESGITEFSKKVEAGATLEGLQYVLETGLVAGQYPIKFEVFAKGNINTLTEHSVNVMVEEKASKSLVFQSKDITIHDLYPNPVNDHAFIEYRLHNDVVKAKMVIHNILGSSVNDLSLSYNETKVKIEASDMSPGVYFYTVYLDNIGVLTRKLIVRR
jgi:Secretion system C-terminal sorting domain